MRFTLFLLASFFGAATLAEPAADSPGRLLARAEPAPLDVAPLTGDSRTIVPRELAFTLTVESECAPDAKPGSLSMSIADARVSLAAAQIAAVTVTDLVLPGAQAGPLHVDGFCRAGDARTTGPLLLEDAYTARLSLTCVHRDQASIVYLTLPLSVLLICRMPDADAAGV
jgi:hypothetical protein